MNRIWLLAVPVSLSLLLLGEVTGYSQQPGTKALRGSSYRAALAEPPPMTEAPAVIIKNFIAAETKFRAAMINFSFNRSVVLRTIGPAGEITGEYIRDSAFVLDDRGQRIERVIYHPRPTTREIIITKEDIQDLAGSQLFGLEPADLKSYQFSYVGEETRDGRRLYVIAARPSQAPDPQHMRARYFIGRFWIDAVSLQPVYVEGVTEPHGKQRFANFKTERQTQVENLLFPSRTTGDEILKFPTRDVHYQLKVTYSDFRRFAARVKIREL